MIYVIVTCVWHVWGGEYDLRHFITLCWLQWRVEKTHQVTCENLAWVYGGKVYAGSFEGVAILVDSIYPRLMQWCQACNNYPPRTTKLFGGILVSLTPSVHPASPVRSVTPTVLVGSILYYTSIQATSEGVSHVKFLAQFQNLNFWQFLKICNFDFVLFWLGIWCESLVWVNMGRLGVSQNAGVLVLVYTRFMFSQWSQVPLYHGHNTIMNTVMQ